MQRKKNLSEEDLEEVKNRYLGGLTAAQVSAQLHFNEREILDFLRKNDFFGKVRRTVDWVDADHIRCSRCHIVKPLDQIVYNANNYRPRPGAYQSYCKECRQRRRKSMSDGRPRKWSDRLSRVRSRCLRNGVECTITAEYLETLWERQGGLCVYTLEPMLDSTGSGSNPMNVSVDRIDYSRGYEPGNVVLCTARANTIKHNQTLEEMKEWMPLWYSRLTSFINEGE